MPPGPARTGWKFESKTTAGSREVSGGVTKLTGRLPTTMPAFGAPAMSASSSALYCVVNVASAVRLFGLPVLTAPRKSLPPSQRAMKVGCRAMA